MKQVDCHCAGAWTGLCYMAPQSGPVALVPAHFWRVPGHNLGPAASHHPKVQARSRAAVVQKTSLHYYFHAVLVIYIDTSTTVQFCKGNEMYEQLGKLYGKSKCHYICIC